MADEGQDFATGLHVPDLDLLVLAGGGEAFAPGAKARVRMRPSCPSMRRTTLPAATSQMKISSSPGLLTSAGDADEARYVPCGLKAKQAMGE